MSEENKNAEDISVRDVISWYKDYRMYIVGIVTFFVGLLGGNSDRVDEWLPTKSSDGCECYVEDDRTNQTLDDILRRVENLERPVNVAPAPVVVPPVQTERVIN